MATISKNDIKIVLFCGGIGSRMWPISKAGHPKQFDVILGRQSFFRQSLDRALKCVGANNIFISTGASFKPVIIDQAPEIPTQNIITEPEMRDNLGAEKFISTLKKAAQLAKDNDVIVHIDMKPTYPSVHNGWIKIGKKLKTEDGFEIFEFIKQVEKPDLTRAKEFFKSGSYLIHSGYMATKPALLLEKYKKHTPECYKIISTIAESFDTKQYEAVLKREYIKIERNSVDYGLFEKLKPGSQWELPVDIGWVDLGTWELLYNGLPKDNNNNVSLGKVEFMETNNSLVLSRDNKTVGVIGLENVIIVDTADGLLVCNMAKASLVKQLYKQIYGKK